MTPCVTYSWDVTVLVQGGGREIEGSKLSLCEMEFLAAPEGEINI